MLSKSIAVLGAAVAVMAGVECVVTSSRPSSPEIRLLVCVESDPDDPGAPPKAENGFDCVEEYEHTKESMEWLTEHGYELFHPRAVNPGLEAGIPKIPPIEDWHIPLP